MGKPVFGKSRPPCPPYCIAQALNPQPISSMWWTSRMDTNQLRFIRAMKPLRWFKLARVIKLNKAGAAVDFIVDYFSIAPSYHRLLSLCGGMFGAIHLAACASWLVKVSLASPCIVPRSCP